MKNLFIAALLVGSANTTYSQGQIILDNSTSNTNTSPSATSNGLFWLSMGGAPAALINQDFNAAFYGGTDSGSLSLLATFLLSDGTAAHDNAFGSGTFSDPTGRPYPIAGAGESAFFQIQAWTGTGPAPTLVRMPAVVLDVPEPSTLVLACFAALCLFLFRRHLPSWPAVSYRQ